MAKGIGATFYQLGDGDSQIIAPVGGDMPPGQNETVYLWIVNIQVTIPTPGGTVTVSDSKFGNKIAIIDGSIPFNRLTLTFNVGMEKRLFEGLPMPAGSSVLCSVVGCQAHVQSTFEVR